MRFWKKLSRLKAFSKFIDTEIAAETVISQAQQQRMMLDKRLNEVTKATLNGETELFQDIFAKDPECALRMIKECDVK